MHKFILFIVIAFVFCIQTQAQYALSSVGPVSVTAGNPIESVVVNNNSNVAEVPAGQYITFMVTLDWTATNGGPWSNEARVSVRANNSNTNFLAPTSGAAENGNPTTLTFRGTLPGAAYDPGVDSRIWLRFDQTFGGSTANYANIVVTIFPTPTNDACSNAIPIECGMQYIGDTTAATDNGGRLGRDVFYSLAGTDLNDEITVSLCGSTFDTYLYVFDACSGNQIALNDDSCGLQSEVTFTSNGTSNYIIQVDGFGAGDFGPFNLDISCVTPCTPTATQATASASSDINLPVTGNATLNWNRGGGDKVLVVMRAGSAVNAEPQIGTAYAANVNFGNGDELGTGNFVVYNGTAETVSVSGLSASETYHFAIYEYSDPVLCYNTDTTGATGNFFVPCASFTAPFFEGFESGVPPGCWTSFRGTNGLGTSNDWETTNFANSGNSAAFVEFEDVTGGLAEDWLVTPAIDLSSIANPTLTFFTAQTYLPDYGSVYSIRVSETSQTDIGSFTNIATYTEADIPFDYQEFSVDLSAYDGQTIYVAFVITQDDGDDWYIDDVSINGQVTYTYNNGWIPFNPESTSTTDNDIFIENGNAVFESGITECGSILVNPTGDLTVNGSATINATRGITLQSVSDNYSSLILDGTINGTVTYQRYVNIIGSGNTSANDLVSAPLIGQTFADFAAANAGILAASGNVRAWAPFNNNVNPGVYQNYNVITHANTTLEAGVGYRAATINGEALNFSGTVETGTVSRNITVGPGVYKEWNLIGNPYPSYITIEDFLNHEVAPGVTNLSLMNNASGIYGYDGEAQNGWDVITLANATGRYMAPGQGFFVAADAIQSATYALEFTPAMRSIANVDDFILGRTAPLTFLKLKAARANQDYTTAFYFNENAGPGLDSGYDAQTWGGTSSGFILYSHLVSDNTGVPLALQALHPDQLNEVRIPLGLNASSGTITFSVVEAQLPAGTLVYLEDTVTNSFTLISHNGYQVNLNGSVNGTGRFFLRFTSGTLSNNDFNTRALNIYHQPQAQHIVISGQLANNTKANLYDLQGRSVRSVELKSSQLEQHVDVSGLSTGVYILHFENGVNTISKKLMIH